MVLGTNPDRYISWVDAGGIQLMNEEAFYDWNQLPKAVSPVSADLRFQVQMKQKSSVTWSREYCSPGMD